MKSIFLFCISLICTINSYAHRGDILAISNVEVTNTNNHYLYTFNIENIASKNMTDVQVAFVANGTVLYKKYFKQYTATPKFQQHQFRIPKTAIDLKKDVIQIEITHIFNKKNDWGGWDAPTYSTQQNNTLASEVYVDAPWRMKKTDDSNNDLSVPIHFFVNDADEILTYTLKIDYINIKVKSASASAFGPVLTYNTLSETEIQNLVSCGSIADNDLNSKAFDASSFSATATETMNFDIESDFWDDYVSIPEDLWYFTFNIPASDLTGLDNIIDIEITIAYANTAILYDDVFRMRVFRSDNDIPSQDNYYRGDTHLHSMYTNNTAEIGLPLCGTKEAAARIGIDWITTTDHSSDFDNYGLNGITNNWSSLQANVAALNTQDDTMLFIPGQEVAALNSQLQLVHMLAYPSFNAPMSLPFLGDGLGDLTPTTVTIDNVITSLTNVDGFSYAAHPYATEDKLPLIPVNGGVWNLGHDDFPDNDETFPETGGDIICNNTNVVSDVLDPNADTLIKNVLKGSQIWNAKSTLSVSGSDGDNFDAWDITNTGTALSPIDDNDLGFHIKRFRQGQEVVNHINQLGLALRNTNEDAKNWKMYYSGGSDAHGSFNFSNTNNFEGTGTITNAALGKINTLAYCPTGMGTNGSNVLKALFYGNTTMSDGPIVTIGISTDGNNTVNEILMGEDQAIDPDFESNYVLNINYTTSAEFGDVTELKLIIGDDTGTEYSNTLTLSNLNGNQLINYPLMDIMEIIMGSTSTPVDEFVYLRAELKTNKDYGSNNDIYKIDNDTFYSFTNPIWVNWDTSLAIDEYALENQVSLHPNPTNNSTQIQLEQGHPFKNLSVFTVLGQEVLSQKIINNNNIIDLKNNAPGMYIVSLYTKEGHTISKQLLKQ